MSMRRTVILGSLGWVAVISLLHGAMNLGVFDRASARRARGDAPFRVGFIPVTCHLTCPVTNFINEKMTGDGIFEPIRFNGWPELKETFLANDLAATFILAPMAMSLREQGVPIKIVYLGHRDGTTMMVRKDSTIFRIEDLQGRTIADGRRPDYLADGEFGAGIGGDVRHRAVASQLCLHQCGTAEILSAEGSELAQVRQPQLQRGGALIPGRRRRHRGRVQGKQTVGRR